MKLGFTGTRHGMAPKQVVGVVDVLVALKPAELHHGDCLGADKEAQGFARRIPDIKIISHPPIKDKHRAFTEGNHSIREPLPYLERNQEIVMETDLLLAAPGEQKEVRRSGTWSTVRYAVKTGRMVLIIYPDGLIEWR